MALGNGVRRQRRVKELGRASKKWKLTDYRVVCA